MSLIESLTGGARSAPKQAEFVAFLTDSASVETVKKAVLESMIPHTLVMQGTVADAIDALKQLDRPPRQLMVDVSGSAMPLSELAALAEACEPSISVIVVGERNDVGLFRDLLRMGVNDYLSKPLTVDLLRRTFLTPTGTAAPVQQARTGKLVAFVSARGGSGVSTIAANLAWNLSHTDRRVAYVDLDVYGGGVTALLNCQSNDGLVDVLRNINRLDPQYVERSLVQVSPKLFLLSAALDMATDFTIDVGALMRLLDILRQHFHYVFADLPGRGGLMTQAVEEKAQTVVIVADPSVQSVRETARLLKVAENRDARAPILVALNNPWPAAKGTLSVTDFEAAIGRAVSQVLPFDRQAVSLAENLGEPVVNGHGPFAMALRRFADDLSGRRSETAPLPWWRKFVQAWRQ